MVHRLVTFGNGATDDEEDENEMKDMMIETDWVLLATHLQHVVDVGDLLCRPALVGVQRQREE